MKSSVDILIAKAFCQIGLKDLTFKKASLVYGFANHSIVVKGFITLLVILGDDKHITINTKESHE